jgi:hypothetical protein
VIHFAIVVMLVDEIVVARIPPLDPNRVSTATHTLGIRERLPRANECIVDFRVKESRRFLEVLARAGWVPLS